MLPPTITGRTWVRSSSPVRVVVVVLPLVPVMARQSASITRQASSSSPMMGTPRARTAVRAGRSSGTPGLTTTSSAPRKASSGWPPAQRATPSRSSARASAVRPSRAPESEASTRVPSRRSRRAAATPLLARPTTATVRVASQSRYGRPRVPSPLTKIPTW